jgi:hypothetical protein
MQFIESYIIDRIAVYSYITRVREKPILMPKCLNLVS